jgi:TP901 family phage tail tape measure protein
MEGLSYSINFTGNATQVLQHVNELLGNTTQAATKATKSIGDSWKTLMGFNQIVQSVDALKNATNELNVPGIALNKNMHDLSAITGVTGAGLKNISNAARESAIAFGTNAAQNVESYKLILSKLDPEIGKNSTALKMMGDNVNVLSKSMGGDTVAATTVLTTAMNQYGVSTKDPIEASRTMADMMNVMAASAKVGSAELPQVGQAIEQSGMQAKLSGLQFSEAAAAIQVLDKAGKKGAEGGVALRNTLAIMGEGRFMPIEVRKSLKDAGVSIEAIGDKTKPLNERLNLLKPLLGDTALLSKMFGKENSAAAIALVQGADQLKEWNTAITGTNSATEQAAIVMDSYEEKQKRVNAKIEDLKISYFNATESMQPYIQSTLNVTSEVGKAAAGVNALSSLFVNDFTKGIYTAVAGLFKKTAATTVDTAATAANAATTTTSSIATTAYTAVMRVFNIVMAANPLGLFLRGLLLVGSALAAGATLLSAYNTHQDRAKELTGDLAAKINVEKSEMNDLFEQLKRTNPKSEHRNELIAELNKRYPDLLKNQHLESMNEAELEKVRRGANDELERTITLQAVKDGKEKAMKEKSEKDIDLTKALFKGGLDDGSINAFRDAVDYESKKVVKEGKYKSGYFEGADDDQISEVYQNIAKRNPTLAKSLANAALKDDATGSTQKIRDFIDQSLTSNNDVGILDRVAGTVDNTYNTGFKAYKNGKTPDDAPVTNIASNVVDKITTKQKEKEKKEKHVKGSTGVAGGNGTGGGSKNIGSITINKLVENITLHVTNLSEGKEKIKQQVAEALLTSVSDFTLANN